MTVAASNPWSDKVVYAVVNKAADPCLGVFYQSALDWELNIPPHGVVLEIGCAEANWLKVARTRWPNAHLVGVDVREAERPEANKHIEGDVFEQQWDPGTFDAIVMVSTLEHIGLGHYGDPVVEGGDAQLLALCREWLKPTGWLYADVPWTSGEPWTQDTSHRVYNTVQLDAVAAGWDLDSRTWYTRSAVRLTPTEAAETSPQKPGFHYVASVWTP